MPTQHLANKRTLLRRLSELAESGPEGAAACIGEMYPPSAAWRGSHPLSALSGSEATAATVWRPLLQAMPDLERRDLILVAGELEGRNHVAAMGHYCGTFHAD